MEKKYHLLLIEEFIDILKLRLLSSGNLEIEWNSEKKLILISFSLLEEKSLVPFNGFQGIYTHQFIPNKLQSML